MRQNPFAIAPLDLGHQARRLRDLPRLAGGHQQPQIPALTELVEIDETRFDQRPFGHVLGFETLDFAVKRREVGGRRRDVRLDALQLFGLDLPIDFELAEVAQERACLRRQAVSFLLQCAQAIGRTARHRLGVFATRRLRAGRGDGEACGKADHESRPGARYHVKCGNHIICKVSLRVLGIDVGRRRIGLAISDRSRTLARPLTTLEVSAATAVDTVAREIERISAEEDGLGEIVVGLPVRLDGSANDETPRVAAFVEALRVRTALPVRTATSG